MNIEIIASEHAGRQLVKGVAPWLREQSTYALVVNHKEIPQAEAWQWILAERPDLAHFGSLKEIHQAHSNSKWLTINHPTSSVELVETDGEPTGYIFDWYPVETIWEQSIDSPHGLIESGRYREELQLRAPDGTVLASFEARVHEFSRGNYPTGDYSTVEEL